MGQRHSAHFPPAVLDAFDERFIGSSIVLEPESYVPYYVLVYEFAFFLRNDPAQSIAEKYIQKMSGDLAPTPHHWMIYARKFIDKMIQIGRLRRYGDDRYPIVFNVRLLRYQNDAIHGQNV